MRKYHYLRVVLSVIVVLSMLVSLVPATVSAATPVTIIASDSSKNTPNDLAYLFAGYYGGTIENAAVKFNLSTTTGIPVSASLQIYVNIGICAGTAGAFNLLGGTDDSWISPNMPSNMTTGTTTIKPNINYSGLVDGWNTIDVTSFVQNHLAADSSKIVSLYMMGIASGVNNDISMYSALNASTAPRLVLSYANDEARLSSIKIGGANLPGFNPDIYTYSYPAAFGSNLSALAFTSTTYDSGAAQSIWAYDTANKKWSVTVTARDGVTKKTYYVTVSADTATATESSKTTYGDASNLYTGYYGGTVENAAIKFNLSAGSGTPASAVLQIYVNKATCTGSAGAFDLNGGTDDTWISPALPANMSVGITAIRANIKNSDLVDGWNSIDVTSFVQSHLAVDSSKIVSLYMMGIASGVDNDISMYSALNAATAPRLVLTYGTNEARLSSIKLGGTNLPGFAADTYEYNYAAIIGTNLSNLVFSSTTYDTNASQSAWIYDEMNHKWSVTVTAKDGTTKKTYNVSVSISDTVAAISSSKTTTGDEGYLYVGYYKDGADPSGVDENAAVKFDLSGCTATPSKVTLKLYVNLAACSGTAGAFDLYGSSDDSWISPALPLSSSLEASAIRSNINFSDLITGWNDIDVTNFVQSQLSSDSTKIVTLYLKGITNTVSNDISIYSATSGSYAPSLSVSFTSSEARLSGVAVGGTTLTGFSADTYSYNYIAPHDTNLSTLAFASTVLDPTASQGAWNYDSANHKWSVTITAQDTTTVKTYSVSVSAVLQSSDASLSSININGTALPGFSSSTVNYTYNAVHGTVASDLVMLSTAKDHMAVPAGWIYNSTDKKWSNTVIAEDGTTKTYAVTINVLPDTDATLKSIKIGGTDIGSFLPSTLNYTYSVVHGTAITAASFVSAVSDDNAIQGTWTYNSGTGKWSVLVTAEDTVTKLTYIVTINELPSTDATLKSIKINGTDIISFSPTTLNYICDVVHGTAITPASFVSAANDHNAVQQNWAFDPFTGRWVEPVTAEDGVTELVYFVTINELPSTDATLKSIKVNGTDIGSFLPSTLDYLYNVAHGTVITAASFVSAVNDHMAQQGTWTYNAGTGKWSVTVTAEETTTQKTYTVTINELPDTDATLKSIKIGGMDVGSFSPTTQDYTFDVVHGTVITAASFVSVVSDDNAVQGVWTYSAVTGKWSVLITAEDTVTKLIYTVTINELPSTDASLKSIKINSTDLVSFSSTTLNYICDVVHETVITAASFVSAANDDNAVMGTWTYNSGTGKWSVPVTAEDGVTSLIYTITINELPSTDANLKSITIGGAAISEFLPSTLGYTYIVAHGTVITSASFVSEVNDHMTKQGTWTYDAVTGKWSVLVTAEDTTTQKTYTVTINELPDTDATLKSIAVDGMGITGFSSSVLDYTCNVAHGTVITAASFVSAANDDNAVQGTWTYDGVTNEWSVLVTAEDGTTQKTYSVTINELASTDATLSSIKISGIDISGFTPSTLDYTYDVVHGIDGSMFSLVSSVYDHMANQGTWTYNAANHKWSNTVTAQDGITRLTYTVTINELPNTDATLKSIAVNGTAVSSFLPSTLDYTYTVAHGTVITAASFASVAADNNAAQGTWTYSASTGKWSVLVTAEDGKTQKTYTVTIHELPDTDATLKSIKIDGTAITGFSSSVVDYTVDVVHGTIITAASFAAASTDVNAMQGTWTYSAVTGKWSVLVTAEDGTTQKTYTITIHELPSTEASLTSIKIGGTDIAGFVPSTLDYAFTALYGTDLAGLVFTSTCSDTNAVQSAWTYDSVNHKWSVTVTAQDTSVQRTYSVTVAEGQATGVLGDYRTNTLSYMSHVQDIGWQDAVSNGNYSGTTGQSKRLEAIKINLLGIAGGIEYCTHVQDIGWMDWSADGNVSGTTAQSKRLEAIKIRLTGEAADKYDIYYRVHVQDTGWMDWAKNGESAGTAACSYRMESIQIVMVLKGDPAPGSTAKAFYNGYTNRYNEQ